MQFLRMARAMFPRSDLCRIRIAESESSVNSDKNLILPSASIPKHCGDNALFPSCFPVWPKFLLAPSQTKKVF